MKSITLSGNALNSLAACAMRFLRTLLSSIPAMLSGLSKGSMIS